MAALDNMAMTLITRLLPGTVAPGQRHLAFNPAELLTLVGA